MLFSRWLKGMLGWMKAYGTGGVSCLRIEWTRFTYFGFFNVDLATDDVRSFLAGGDDCLALRELFQEQTDVGWLYNFQKLVRSIILQASD